MMKRMSVLLTVCIVGAGAVPAASSPVVTEPTPVTDLNTHYSTTLRHMSDDGLTAFVMHFNAPGQNWQEYSHTRADLNSPFGPAERFPFSNVGYGDFTASPDTLTLYFGETGPTYRYTRPDRMSEFGSPVAETNLTNVNPADLSDDGLRLYMTIRDGSSGIWNIAVANKDDLSDFFDSPTFDPFVNINRSDVNDSRPALSSDELELFFSSDRPGGVGSRDIWYASRPSIDVPFGSPVNMTALNTPGYESVSYWWRDTLFFIRVNDVGVGRSVFSATVPEPATLSLLALGGLAVLRRRKK